MEHKFSNPQVLDADLLIDHIEHPCLQEAYSHFNKYIFDHTLPPCLIFTHARNDVALHQTISIQGRIVDSISISEKYINNKAIVEVLHLIFLHMINIKSKYSLKNIPLYNEDGIYRSNFDLACDSLITSSYTVQWYKRYSNIISQGNT